MPYSDVIAAPDHCMSKRPDSLETLQLALELMRRIPRNRKITADELHRQLHDAGIVRDLRSIQRQLKALSAHFGIECDDRSKPHGYRWLPNAEGLAMPYLSPQESLLLRLAEEHLRHLLPPKLMKSMNGFFEQARRNLGEGENAKLEREWPHKVRVVATTQPLLPPKILPDVFETVSNALYANRWLHVEYANAEGKRSKADVMPLGLAQQGPGLYLVCRYKGYDDERTLALHRIQSVAISSMNFQRPKNFNLKRYDDEGRFRFGNGERIRLSFSISHDYGLHLLEMPLSTDQTAVKQGRQPAHHRHGDRQLVADTMVARIWRGGLECTKTMTCKSNWLKPTRHSRPTTNLMKACHAT